MNEWTFACGEVRRDVAAMPQHSQNEKWTAPRLVALLIDKEKDHTQSSVVFCVNRTS